jgi:hypothetical protein
VDLKGELVLDTSGTALKALVIEHLDEIAAFCGVDIFLLGPKFPSLVDGLNGNGDAGRDQRWRVAVYGDMESADHAKTRVLIFIDRLVSFSKYANTDQLLILLSLAVLSTVQCLNFLYTLCCVVVLARTLSLSSRLPTPQSTFLRPSLKSTDSALQEPNEEIRRRSLSLEKRQLTSRWQSRRCMNSSAALDCS